MEKKKNNSLIVMIIVLILTAVYTVLVCTVNKAPIGPNDTVVGFSSVNAAFRDMIGLNTTWDKLSDVTMGIAILAAASFVVVGLIQLIKRKSLAKVDKAILILAGVYVVVVVLYVFFDKVPINYRPFILPDETEPEASFPSTHVLVVATVLCTAMTAWDRIIKENKILLTVLKIAAALVVIAGIVFRIISGVHWITDIVAGALFSASLTSVYVAILDKVE